MYFFQLKKQFSVMIFEKKIISLRIFMLMLINLHLLVTRMLLRGSCRNNKLMKNVCSYILCPQCPYMNGKKIPLKSYMDFTVFYYLHRKLRRSIFFVNPMNSVNLMSVKVMHCTTVLTPEHKWPYRPFRGVKKFRVL